MMTDQIERVAIGVAARPRRERGQVIARIIAFYAEQSIDDTPCTAHDEAGETARRFAIAVAQRVKVIEQSGNIART